MLVARVSPISGINVLDLPVTQEQLDAYAKGNIMIQDAFPNLTPDQREFIQTGYTAEEWEQIFSEVDD